MSATIWSLIARSYFDSLFASLSFFVLSLPGLAAEDDEEDGACALGEGVLVELLELEAGGDGGATVTEVDEDEGGGVADAEGPGALEELLELDGLDGLVCARAEGCVALDEDEDEDLPGAPAGPGDACRSQPASARAPTLNATRSGINGRVMTLSFGE